MHFFDLADQHFLIFLQKLSLQLDNENQSYIRVCRILKEYGNFPGRYLTFKNQRKIYLFGIPALINPSIKTSLMIVGATFS